MPECNYKEKDQVRLLYGLAPEEPDEERAEFRKKAISNKEPGCFIMAHAQLPITVEKNLFNALAQEEDTAVRKIIIDEDPIKTLIARNSYSLDDLSQYARVLSGELRNKWNKFLDVIEDNPIGYKFTYDISDILRDLEKNFDYVVEQRMPAIPIFQLEGQEYIIYQDKNNKRGIRTTVLSQLFDLAEVMRVPVIILSAFPHVSELKAYFPHIDFQYKEVAVSKNTGIVKQYARYSGAKGYRKNGGLIDNLTKYFEYMEEKIGTKDIPIITFKLTDKELEHFENLGYKFAKTADGTQIHFFNCAGLDCLKGQDIAVVGKPDYTEEYYSNIYIDLQYKDEVPLDFIKVKPDRKVQWREVSNIKSKASLFVDDRLRAIQEENITHLIEQAIGRARVLREDCNVYVFNDFIVPSADRIYDL